jgi:hypothetical protein
MRWRCLITLRRRNLKNWIGYAIAILAVETDRHPDKGCKVVAAAAGAHSASIIPISTTTAPDYFIYSLSSRYKIIFCNGGSSLLLILCF